MDQWDKRHLDVKVIPEISLETRYCEDCSGCTIVYALKSIHWVYCKVADKRFYFLHEQMDDKGVDDNISKEIDLHRCQCPELEVPLTLEQYCNTRSFHHMHSDWQGNLGCKCITCTDRGRIRIVKCEQRRGEWLVECNTIRQGIQIPINMDVEDCPQEDVRCNGCLNATDISPLYAYYGRYEVHCKAFGSAYPTSCTHPGTCNNREITRWRRIMEKHHAN